MPGFIKGKKLKKMGMKAQDTAELFFEDVRLPQSAVLGEVNKGFYAVMQELPQERLLIADIAIASGEAVYDGTALSTATLQAPTDISMSSTVLLRYEWSREYTKDRQVFKGSLSDLQTVRHRLAEMKTELCVGRMFVDRCLELHAQGRLDSQMASMVRTDAIVLCPP